MIFILREPADRARANYLWSCKNGLETEDFATALELEAEREAAYPAEYRFSRPYSYYSRGLYARHLRPYLERLSRDRVLIMRYEDIAEDPTKFADACPGVFESRARFFGRHRSWQGQLGPRPRPRQ